MGGVGAVIGGLVNGAFGLGLQKQQQKYTQENMKLAHEMNEKSADRSDERKRKFYTEFESPEAIMRQLKEAGLSPGLYYGGGGTAGHASGGAQATTSALAGAGYTNPGLGLDISQMKLNEAQARNLNADADYKEGKNAGGQADIATKLADAGLKEAQKTYTKAQERYTEALETAQNFQNSLTDEARKDLLDEYKWRVKEMQANYEKTMSEAKQNTETLELLKQKFGAEIAEIQTQAALNATKNEVTKEEIEKIRAETYSVTIQAENEKKKEEWIKKELETRLESTGMMKKAIIISAAIGAGANVVKGLMDIFNPAKGLAKLLRKGEKGAFQNVTDATEKATGYYGIF